MNRVTPALLVALSLTCAPAPIGSSPARAGLAHVRQEPHAQLRALMDEILEARHERFPEQVGPFLGDDTYNDRLTDNSPAAVAAWTQRQAQWLERARALDLSGASEEDHLNRDLLVYNLELALRLAPLHREQMPVSTMGGPQVWLPQLGDRVPMTRPHHREDWVRRLEQIPNVIGDAIDQMRAGLEAGRVPPRVVIEPTIEQAMAQTSSSIREDPTTSPFYAPLRDLDPGSALSERAQAAIRDRIIPAYTELALFLQNEYLPACRDTIAISDSIDGELAYELALKEHTTLDLTAEEVHQIGLDEVARIKKEMMEVIRRSDWYGSPIVVEGVSDPEDDDAVFAAFVEYLRTDERFYFDEPEELLNAYRSIAKVIDAEMPRLFGRLPRMPYGVRAVPEYAAPAAPTAFYYAGSLEGGIPGYFMANTHALDQRPKYDIVALTLHEAVPGHHHQIALTQELENIHPLRRLTWTTAFGEGWGLYAERLGLEMGEDLVDDGVDRGLYADPYDDFGRLNFEMWRAMRLVVDTGLHAKGWSRQRAIDYMLANGALTETNVRNEVDRYIGWPGQATAYKIGQLKILELRERAEAALGDRFDLRAFHDAVLSSGSIPLPVLEAKIDRWIESQR
ncbi:MAG: DUF885 domain-containing protein [Phycisphaerales bacterium JB059]